MPVLNGGEYIRECLKSIFSQTNTDFTLHILDSGSTDGTLEWISALPDPRVRLYRSDKLLSVEQNWGRIKDIPRNEWMTIIGHDDKFYPNYLDVMDSLIHEYPDAGLLGTHFDFIDKNGKIFMKTNPMARKMMPAEFMEKMITNEIGVVSMMMRSADFDKIGGVPSYPSLLFADFPFYIELARLSYVVISPENCLSYRIHNNNTTNSAKYELFYEAYENYIQYLVSLKLINEQFRAGINKTAKRLIRKRSIEFTSKLLRTPKANRKSFKTISALLKKHRLYADMLIDDNDYDPMQERSFKIAEFIDKTWLTRKLFVLAKRIYKGPILRIRG